MERKKIILAVVVLVFVSFAIPIEATIQPSFQGLGDLPGGDVDFYYNEAYGVSADGSVVVGGSFSVPGFEAFRLKNTDYFLEFQRCVCYLVLRSEATSQSSKGELED